MCEFKFDDMNVGIDGLHKNKLAQVNWEDFPCKFEGVYDA